MPAVPARALKSFTCGDVVPGCSRSFIGTDDSDILSQVAAHAAADHGLVTVPTHVVGAVRAAIRNVTV